MGNDYEVGYRKPPKKRQFKRGQSGNPAGRPKGSLNLISDFSAELSERITIREDGRSRRISKQRALIKSLMVKALQGNVRATVALLSLYTRIGIDSAEDNTQAVDATDLKILQRFAPRILKAIAKEELANGTPRKKTGRRDLPK